MSILTAKFIFNINLYVAKRFVEMDMILVLFKVLLKFESNPCEEIDIPLQLKISSGSF